MHVMVKLILNIVLVYSVSQENRNKKKFQQKISALLQWRIKPICFSRNVEWNHKSSNQDTKTWYNDARSFPAGGSDHEETTTRQARSTVRSCF